MCLIYWLVILLNIQANHVSNKLIQIELLTTYFTIID